MRSLAGAGAGFLFCVLWFDLMFDVQARGYADDDVPTPVRASIAAYYARVTTSARPMNQLIALTMLVTIGATVGEIVRDELPAWRGWTALALTLAAIGLAAARTVANARRLGAQADDGAQQSRLARRILRDHVFCISCIAITLVLQLAPV